MVGSDGKLLSVCVAKEITNYSVYKYSQNKNKKIRCYTADAQFQAPLEPILRRSFINFAEIDECLKYVSTNGSFIFTELCSRVNVHVYNYRSLRHTRQFIVTF